MGVLSYMRLHKLFIAISCSFFSANAIAGNDYSFKSNPFSKKYVYIQSGAITQPTLDKNLYSKDDVKKILSSKKKKVSSYNQASKYEYLYQNPKDLGKCWDGAGKQYNIDPWLLFAIANVESSFKNDAINDKNRNKSTDFGIMQINSWWLPKLAERGIKKAHLFDPCVNIFVGGWVLSQTIKQYGYNLDGIGAYNSPNIKTRRNYARKVLNAYNELVRDFYTNAHKPTSVSVSQNRAQLTAEQAKVLAVATMNANNINANVNNVASVEEMLRINEELQKKQSKIIATNQNVPQPQLKNDGGASYDVEKAVANSVKLTQNLTPNSASNIDTKSTKSESVMTVAKSVYQYGNVDKTLKATIKMDVKQETTESNN